MVQLNLNRDLTGNKKINILPKEKTSKKLKSLSNEQVIEIKKNLKKKKKNYKVEKKIIENNEKKIKKNKKKFSNKDKANLKKKNLNKLKNDVVDVCTILKKCNIDEISKYLLKEGKKSFLI